MPGGAEESRRPLEGVVTWEAFSSSLEESAVGLTVSAVEFEPVARACGAVAIGLAAAAVTAFGLRAWRRLKGGASA